MDRHPSTVEIRATADRPATTQPTRPDLCSCAPSMTLPRTAFVGRPARPGPHHSLLPAHQRGGRSGRCGAIPLFQKDERGKERLGLALPMPVSRENNGGKAYFLAESCVCIFGRVKETGDPIVLLTRSSRRS